MAKTKPKLSLCCITNPDVNEKGLVMCWCSYCNKLICNDCIQKYTTLDGYVHHKECMEECSHSRYFHKHTGDEEPRPVNECL